MYYRYLSERQVIESLLAGAKHAFVVYDGHASHFGDMLVTLCRTADADDGIIRGSYEYNDPLFSEVNDLLKPVLSLVCGAISEVAKRLERNVGQFDTVAGRGFPVKQTNGVDCGVYVIMRFWALITGQVVDATNCFIQLSINLHPC